MKEDIHSLLAALRDQVLEAMEAEPLPDEATQIRLARDYRSYVRMGHAPRWARRLAEQIAFQQRWYLDEGDMEELALAVCETLADIYEERLSQANNTKQ